MLIVNTKKARRKMICIVLAAGYATRLYPLTENFPKPLLSVGGKPLLNWLLEDIDQIPEVTEFVVISNHKFINHFESWAAEQKFTRPIRVLDDGSTDNENRLGAVKDILFAVETLQIQDDILVVAGDNLVNFSFSGFLSFMREKQASCVMCHEENDLKKQQRTAIIVKDENDKILSYEEKPQVPKGNLAVPPFYCYLAKDAARLSEALDAGCKPDAPGSFAAWLSRNTDVYAWNMPGKRYDIGDRASYEAVKELKVR